MKMKVLFVLICALSVSLFAQEKLNREQWEARMNAAQAKVDSYNSQVKALQADVDRLSETSAKLIVPNCDQEQLKIVGAKQADVDAFRKAVNELEGKLRRREEPREDRVKDLEALRSNPISALPEFFNKVQIELPKLLEEWAQASEEQKKVEAAKDKMYTVVKGDCLWLIAKKKDHYGNGFAWPKIFKANKEQIKDPNLIYPKQIFKIPNLTEDEKAKFEKLRHNYKPAPAK